MCSLYTEKGLQHAAEHSDDSCHNPHSTAHCSSQIRQSVPATFRVPAMCYPNLQESTAPAAIGSAPRAFSLLLPPRQATTEVTQPSAPIEAPSDPLSPSIATWMGCHDGSGGAKLSGSCGAAVDLHAALLFEARSWRPRGRSKLGFEASCRTQAGGLNWCGVRRALAAFCWPSREPISVLVA